MFICRIDNAVELRLLQEHNADALFALAGRNREYLREWLPWVDTTHTAADTRRFIAGALERFARNEGFAAGIWLDGALAGSIGLHRIDWANRAVSIGYWLSAEHQGRGIVTAACRAVLDHGFGALGLNRIEIRCGTGNRKSCAIPERRFQKEGLLRQAEWVSGRFVDLFVYGMLASEWKSSGDTR